MAACELSSQNACTSVFRRVIIKPPLSLFVTTQSYKERLRNELSRKFEFDAQQKSAATQELTQAVPPTETLNSEPQKSRAELASTHMR